MLGVRVRQLLRKTYMLQMRRTDRMSSVPLRKMHHQMVILTKNADRT
jgi:hypothetical protein